MKHKKIYTVVLEHDKGKIRIRILANSIMDAREIVKRIELCPDSAILAVLPPKKGIKS